MTGAAQQILLRTFETRFAALARRRRTETLIGVSVAALLVLASVVDTEFYPSKLLAGLPKIGEYIDRLFSVSPGKGQDRIAVLAWGHVFGGVDQPQSIAYWFYRIRIYLGLLWQTVEMAIIATVMGAAVGLLLSFPAARNLGAPPWVRFATRRGLEFGRSVPQVVLAFILIWPFGIGPLAGILAIAIHTAGALGKMFAELNENADTRPADGIVATGGSWVAMLRYGILPQVLPGFISYALLRFEINVRSSTIIGFVGAGGIGQEFRRVLSFNIYEEVSAIVILILVIVTTLDLASERIRSRFLSAGTI